MKLHQLIALACVLLAVSACVVEPFGGGGRGGYYAYGQGQQDYGRRVWR